MTRAPRSSPHMSPYLPPQLSPHLPPQLSPHLPPQAASLASFTDLVGAAVRVATQRLDDGSRRNVADSLARRDDALRHEVEVLAGLSTRPHPSHEWREAAGGRPA